MRAIPAPNRTSVNSIPLPFLGVAATAPLRPPARPGAGPLTRGRSSTTGAASVREPATRPRPTGGCGRSSSSSHAPWMTSRPQATRRPEGPSGHSVDEPRRTASTPLIRFPSLVVSPGCAAVPVLPVVIVSLTHWPADHSLGLRPHCLPSERGTVVRSPANHELVFDVKGFRPARRDRTGHCRLPSPAGR